MHRSSDITDRFETGFEDFVEALDRAFAGARASLSLSHIECQIIRCLCRRDESVGAVARTIGAGRSSVSMAASRLEARGMITRRSMGARSVLSVVDSARAQYEAACRVPMRTAVRAWADATLAEHPAALTEVERLFASTREALARAREHHLSRDLSHRVYEALVRGDVDMAGTLVRPLVSAGDPLPAYEAISYAMWEVGDGWERGELPISTERVASSAAAQLVDRLHAMTRHGRPASDAPSALVCASVDGEHVLGPRLVANELERARWNVTFIGGRLPASEIVDAQGRVGADITCLGVTCASDVPAAVELVALLARRGIVVVGGRATHDLETVRRIEAAGGTACPSLGELDGVLASLGLAGLVRARG